MNDTPGAPRPALFIVLSVHVSLHLLPVVERQSCVLKGQTFRLDCSGNGFYDYLRNREGGIVGLRLSFFRQHNLQDYFEGLDYVHQDDRRLRVEVYFSSIEFSMGDDQAFGDDAIWVSKEGVYALQVGTDSLNNFEYRSLLRWTDREWATSGR